MKLKVKNNKGLSLFFMIFTIVIFICCMGLFVFSFMDGEYLSAIGFSTFTCAMCALVAMLARGMRRWEIQLNEHDLVYTPYFGAPKTIPYSGIQKINTGGSVYILYSMDGKKLLAFDDFRVENASLAVSFLKNKGVKSEL